VRVRAVATPPMSEHEPQNEFYVRTEKPLEVNAQPIMAALYHTPLPSATLIAGAIAAGVALAAAPLAQTNSLGANAEETPADGSRLCEQSDKLPVQADALRPHKKGWKRLNSGIDPRLIMHTKRERTPKVHGA
jgi:hypothetical protein